MKVLLQQITAFLRHDIDTPETAPETRETAQVLIDEVVNAIDDITTDNTDRSPQA